MLLSINSFRGFKSAENIKIAPLTILVGENSAGKTSFLAAIRLIYELLATPELISFNKEPFLLGAYDQIAHYRGGKSGRAPIFKFKIELEVTIGRQFLYFSERKNLEKENIEVVSCEFEFVNEFSSPSLNRIILSFKDGNAEIERSSDGTISIRTKTLEKTVDTIPYSMILNDERMRARNLINVLDDLPFIIARNKDFKGKDRKNLEKFDLIGARFRALRRTLFSAIYASAPVRTEPGRAYTPLDANPNPQGGHVPYLLARLKRHDAKKWAALKDKIDDFGQSSGMFNKIDVKNLGRSESDPFQIYFDFGGPKRNIIDVGYGVSQVLPLITEVMSRDVKTKFLFQQPEVHLHPQAQAALGSFLANETARNQHSFVVESHSDFIIDRARMAVRDKILPSNDVAILYFKRERLESHIFQIKVDEVGNIVDAPQDYRRFFMEEERRSVGS